MMTKLFRCKSDPKEAGLYPVYVNPIRGESDKQDRNKSQKLPKFDEKY